MCNAVLYPAGASLPVVPAEVAVLIVRALKRDTVHKDGGRNSHPKSVDEQLKHIGLVRIASSRVSCSVEHRAPSALQVAVMLGTVETRLRTCSLLDPLQHYTQPLPRKAMNSSALTLARTAAANGRSNEELRLRHVVHYSDRMDNAVLRASTHLRTKLVAAHPDVDWLRQCDPVAPRSAWPGPPPYSHTSEHLLCTSEHFRRSSVHLRRTRAKPSRATQGFGSCDDRCTCAATFRNRFPMMARAARASVRRSPRTLDLTRRGVGARPVLAGGEQRSANARPGAHSLCLRCISARRPECGTSATLTLAALGAWPPASRIRGCGVW